MSDLVKRLRDCGIGKDVIRCQNKEDKSYCIQFELWEQCVADEWWKQNRLKDWYKNKELVKVRVHSQKDLLMLEAAEEVERLKALLRETLERYNNPLGVRFTSDFIDRIQEAVK